jgi:uncharacterized membrane protein HdeD (DUF308 family)
MTNSANTRGGDQNELTGRLRSKWGWLLAFGILSMILGFIGLSFTFALSVASAFLFGILLVVGGAGQIISCFKEKGMKGKLWHAVVAVLYIVAGIILLQNPLEGSILLTAVLGGALVAAGIFRILTALSSRQEKGWVWVFISGIVTLILGGIIISQWPVSGLWVIGMFIAVDLIVSGWGYVALALAARASTKA